jgi:DNA replication protein DnaC
LTTIEETIARLHQLRLPSMAQAVRELLDTAPGSRLSFDEKVGLVVDREWTERDDRRLSHRLKDAKLANRASLGNVMRDPERGVDKPTLRQLSQCQWVKSKHNVIGVGKTGVGKSYVGSALADDACRAGYRALFVRVLSASVARETTPGLTPRLEGR